MQDASNNTGAVSVETWDMYEHSDGWLVDDNYFSGIVVGDYPRLCGVFASESGVLASNTGGVEMSVYYKSALVISLANEGDIGKPTEQAKEDTPWPSELLNLFNEIEPLGTFVTSNQVETDGQSNCLQIVVEGVGKLEFPLSDSVLGPLQAVATKSLFGHQNEKLYDESVRKGWEIDGSKITIGSSEQWGELLQKVVHQACHELGLSNDRCNSMQVNAHFCKLLVYETGGHFRPHRDTMKEHGMFGTLVIQLPSLFTGGSFTVSHGTETKTFALAQDCADGLKYIAFYSDCEHQLHTVTSGVRACLVYSLVALHSDKSLVLSHANINSATEFTLQGLVAGWKADQRGIGCLGYPLAHMYKPSSFNVLSLKGQDRIVFHTLKAARTVSGSSLFKVRLLMIQPEEPDDCCEDGYDGYGGGAHDMFPDNRQNGDY